MALEPVAGQVYFSPECHAEYERLGFSPSPGTAGGRLLPDGPAYFTSRGSVMGQVSGTVGGRRLRRLQSRGGHPVGDPGLEPDRCRHHLRRPHPGRHGQLVRILGAEPAGTGPGHRAVGRAGGAIAARGAAALRRPAEPRPARRPDGRHVAAGRPAPRVPGRRPHRRLDLGRPGRHRDRLLSELYWGLPLRTYMRTRAWSDEQLDGAEARLLEHGLLADGG
jgi:hypothetical protein